MSNVYTGFVATISEKSGNGKRGRWTLYSAKIEKEDGTEYDDWISFGFDKPSLKKGDYVIITTNPDDRGYQKVAHVEFPKNPPSKGSKAAPAGASANVAAPSGGKERSIHYQSARKDAIEMINVLVSMDALPITSAKTKAGEAKRYEELMELVDKLTVRYFNDTESQRILETVADEGIVEHTVGKLPEDSDGSEEETDE